MISRWFIFAIGLCFGLVLSAACVVLVGLIGLEVGRLRCGAWGLGFVAA